MISSLSCSLFLMLCLVPTARGDTFEQFTTTGQFLNFPNVALTGGFIVDETTGQVVSVDFFHDTTELNLLASAGATPGVPNVFHIGATNSLADHLGLLLVAPGNAGSLVGYTGGPICADLMIGQLPDCAFNSSAFFSHLFPDDAYAATDDLFVGQVTDAGPVATPDPSTLALLATGFGCLLIRRRRV
jgi:hypothetical protein